MPTKGGEGEEETPFALLLQLKPPLPAASHSPQRQAAAGRWKCSASLPLCTFANSPLHPPTHTTTGGHHTTDPPPQRRQSTTWSERTPLHHHATHPIARAFLTPFRFVVVHLVVVHLVAAPFCHKDITNSTKNTQASKPWVSISTYPYQTCPPTCSGAG